MTKTLNTEAISNELKGASLFFSRPPAPEALKPQETSVAEAVTPMESPAPSPSEGQSETQTPLAEDRTPERSRTRPGERTDERPHERTPVRRRARRYSFEIYEDQIERVRRLALEDQLRGGTLNQSEIVRSALDRYLATIGETGE